MTPVRALVVPLFLALAGCEAETLTTPVIVQPPCVEVDVYPGGVAAAAAAADADPRALTAFRDQLAPYGAWSDDSTWGTVWTPYDEGFVPYETDGHWARLGDGDKDDKAVWLSDTSWGAVTCHHGRWVATRTADGRVRWRWVPGLRYAGSWATWTHQDGRVGWGPTPPNVIWRNGVAQRIAPLAPVVVASREPTELSDVTARPDETAVAADTALRAQVERNLVDRREAMARRLSRPVALGSSELPFRPGAFRIHAPESSRFARDFAPGRAESFANEFAARSSSAWGASAFGGRSAGAFTLMSPHAGFSGASAARLGGVSHFSGHASVGGGFATHASGSHFAGHAGGGGRGHGGGRGGGGHGGGGHGR